MGTARALLMLFVVTFAAPHAWCEEPSPPQQPGGGAQRAAPKLADTEERRRTFVGVVGFLALVCGCVGLVLVLRKRREQQAEPPPAKPTPVVRKVTRQKPPAPAGTKVCPTCRQDYEAGARFCKYDGNRLIGARESQDPRGPAGGVCPTCEHGFDPGVSQCPVDGDELIPWALTQLQEEPPSQQFPKICPVCGSHYRDDADFCRSDGASLVTVN